MNIINITIDEDDSIMMASFMQIQPNNHEVWSVSGNDELKVKDQCLKRAKKSQKDTVFMNMPTLR